MKLIGGLIAILLVLAGTYIWWSDGAWELGAMQTSALLKTLGFSALSIFCFGLAHLFSRDK